MDNILLRHSIRSAAQAGFSRSSGPGGQNVNKLNTKVTLHLPLSSLEGLSEAELSRVRTVLANRITNNDEIIINCDEERFQRSNLERAYSRLETLITQAARLPKLRRPSKIPRAVKEKRLQTKRQHSEKKALRKKLI